MKKEPILKNYEILLSIVFKFFLTLLFQLLPLLIGHTVVFLKEGARVWTFPAFMSLKNWIS